MDKTKDLLYQAVKFYDDNLAGKKFEIIAGKNKNQSTKLLILKSSDFIICSDCTN